MRPMTKDDLAAKLALASGDIERLKRERDEARRLHGKLVLDASAKLKRMEDAIRWVCGEIADADGKWFGDHEPPVKPWQRPFWWRTPLRKLSGIDEQAAHHPLDYRPITGPGVDALERREPAAMESAREAADKLSRHLEQEAEAK
jgi:hypothetical protein